MKTALLVLAAGMGSRYGGLKQLEPFGKENKTLLDYSIEDAIRAGFHSIVFVIRESFFKDFNKKIGANYSKRINIEYAYQKIEDLPYSINFQINRTKPWGTAQAIWAARNLVKNPFAVINADDFYGRDAFKKMQKFSESIPLDKNAAKVAGLMCYRLTNTLSENGYVNRGICKLSKSNLLEGVEEFTRIQRTKKGEINGVKPCGKTVILPENAPVSMNFWAFSPVIFDEIETYFASFLKNKINDNSTEFYIPSLVDLLIKDNRLSCRALETTEHWFGITHPEDKAKVEAELSKIENSLEYFDS